MWKGDEGQAEVIRVHVEHLLDSAERTEPPHRTTLDWLDSLKDHEHIKLVDKDLVEARAVAEPPRTLKVLYDAFLKSKKSMKESTKKTYGQAWTVLDKHFGETRAIDSITKADALVFREWLAIEGNERDKERDDLDVNTVRRRIGICRQIFKHAIESKWLTENPFHGIAASVHANPERFHYVTEQQFDRIIEFSPHSAEMRCIVALNRLIGFRIPSEIQTLKWSDIDLSDDDPHLRIKAPKTEHHQKRGLRTAPIMADLRPYLEDLRDLVNPGVETPLSSPVFPRFVDASDSAIRSAMLKIMKRAGVNPWPNLFSNGRKSAITDLLRAGHDVVDVASWVGNSPAVIWEYYAMATAEARRRAATQPNSKVVHTPKRGPLCGPNQPLDPASSNQHSARRIEKTPVKDGSSGSQGESKWAMRDSNPRHPRCKRGALAN